MLSFQEETIRMESDLKYNECKDAHVRAFTIMSMINRVRYVKILTRSVRFDMILLDIA